MNIYGDLSITGLSVVNTSAPPDSAASEVATILAAYLTVAIENLTETLSISLSALSGLTWMQALFAIFVVVVGAFSAFAFNFLHWRMVDKRQKISDSCSALIGLISDLEKLAVKYWLEDYVEKSRLEIQEAEISIKTKIQLISTYTNLITSQMGGNISAKKRQTLKRFPLDIYDLATGGDFESVTKKSSKATAIKISKSCLKVKATILFLSVSA